MSSREKEYDSQRATFNRTKSSSSDIKMPSSKGEPTDPELREKIKEEVKNEEKGTLGLERLRK